ILRRIDRMEFGMFHQFPVVPGGSESEAFEQAFEQVDTAERCGLNVMWLAELHVDPARSVLAAPMTIASAIAARTDPIKIDIAVTPKPYQKPLPPIRVAASSPDTFPAIGKLGYPIFVMPRGTFSDMLPAIESYREAYRQAGHPGHGRVYLRVPIYVGETAERARAEPEEG